MRGQAEKVQPPGWCLGTVLSAEGGLRIRADGQELDGEDLVVDPRLLAGREIPYTITLDLSASAVTLDIGGASVQTNIPTGASTVDTIPLYQLPGSLTGTISGKVTLDSCRLAPGDQVVLLPDREGQLYYVVCKVVRP